MTVMVHNIEGKGAPVGFSHASVPFPDAPLTLVGVQSLFTPEHLIEIEAVAVVDG